MPVQTTGCKKLLTKLLNDEISTSATFYVAEIAGEHRKYNFDRDFITGKNSPYSLTAGDFREGAVYELKADDVGERYWFQWNGSDDGVPDMTVLDEGDNADADAILEVVAGGDGQDVSVRKRAHNLVDDVDDTDALEVLVDMLESADSSRDPGELANVDLGDVPSDVRDAVMLRQRTFAAAFQKQTGQSPGAHLLAAVRDGAVLAERKERQNGGGN